MIIYRKRTLSHKNNIWKINQFEDSNLQLRRDKIPDRTFWNSIQNFDENAQISKKNSCKIFLRQDSFPIANKPT